MTFIAARHHPGPQPSFINAANQSILIGGIPFAYRDLGPREGVPLVMFNHWGAVLDNFDPRIIDGLAKNRRVIITDYRGIGGSGGAAPLTVGEMADDGIGFIRALGLDKVDLLGFSLGGFVVQDIALKAPERVHRLILTGTGPAGGAGIDNVGSVTWPLMIKGLLTLRDPKFYLFFTRTANGQRAASEYLQRLKERRQDRDKGPTPRAFLRQLKAITAWGKQAPQALGRLQMPTLIANGDNDIMVPTVNSLELAKRIPNAQLILYQDAGHGSIFQYPTDFVAKALAFLGA
ncbi:alpha/beta hydrolase [Pseudomonas brenneri]|uniref:alpha/beta fold hydrolase n=1 Tax=Pseudomonas fluorescens group TaxID=136843 RepID=UPI00067EA1E5|nr:MULTISPECIES: alpha/beta hydrolase [Pseudomonas fluorescens group]MBF8006542.1 alpha/beta hydrolase [Pseudomonas brenneri]MDZ4302848.1 alpha/beta hydrolase [Pseudomonas sp.]WJM93237.1 alpha/beta hydrolase [Pseudomonas brenneri]